MSRLPAPALERVRLAVPARRVAVVAGVLAFGLFALGTNRTFASRSDPLYPADAVGYRNMAAAAPSLPTRRDEKTGQHAQRIVPAYLVGIASRVSGASLDGCYDLAAALVLAAIAVVSLLVLERFPVSSLLRLALVGSVVVSPYIFRLVASAPPLLGDGVFTLGAGVATLGLIDARLSLVAVGLLSCALGRGGSTVLTVAAAAAWLFFDPRLAPASRRRRIARSLAVAAPAYAAYAVTAAIGSTFATTATPGVRGFTILGTLLSLPGSASTLVDHLASTVLGLVVPTCLAAVALVLRYRRRRLSAPPPGVSGTAVLALAILAYPILLNPEWLQGSEPRLAGLATVPLVAVAGWLAADPSVARPRKPWLALALLSGVALSSLHPRYAAVSPAATADRFLPFLLLALALVALGAAWPGRDGTPSAATPRRRAADELEPHGTDSSPDGSRLHRAI